ncbi:MAG: DUF4398 domain-containing protein [Geminicoccaceae bacterium]|nr:DUF4398 domain-containing protein [Geminicoccaceae bacterium]
MLRVQRLRAFSSSVALAALLSACAGEPVPQKQLTLAEQAIGQADEQQVSGSAPAEYALAREKFDQAKQAVSDGRNDDGRRLAEQALVDANLAMARSDAEEARARAEELRAGIEALRDQIQTTPLNK